jgi:hypothetical protein
MKKSCALVAALTLAVAALAPGDSFAQSASDWEFQGTLYAYFPSISGRTTFPPQNGGSGLSLDTGAILDSLDFAFMGTLEARRGRWGGLLDVIYMDLNNSNTSSQSLSIGAAGLPAGVTANVGAGLKGSVWTLATTYRALAERSTTLDVLAGVRVLDIKSSMNWTLSGNVAAVSLPDRTGARETSEQNWDAIVGVKGRLGFGQGGKWFAPYYLDIGTGESSFTWQATAGVGYNFGWGDIIAAWRYTDYKLKSGSSIDGLTLSGPAIAATFRW